LASFASTALKFVRSSPTVTVATFAAPFFRDRTELFPARTVADALPIDKS
jgi:hypothetical protein